MKKSVPLLVLLLLCASQLYAQNATEIVTKARQKFMGKTSKSVMTMKIVRPDWTREVSMKSWSKGTDYFMIYITAPAREEGQVFLKRQDEMWNWVPSISRMIKIPPSMMMQSWMGSDFTNNDLLQMNSLAEDYTHEIIREEEIEGYQCYVIEHTPKPDAAVVWGRVLYWVSKDDYLSMRTEYYDEDDELVNKEIGSEVKTFDGELLPSQMTMTPVQEEGKQTILIYEDLEFNVPVDENFFSQQNMKRVR